MLLPSPGDRSEECATVTARRSGRFPGDGGRAPSDGHFLATLRCEGSDFAEVDGITLAQSMAPDPLTGAKGDLIGVLYGLRMTSSHFFGSVNSCEEEDCHGVVSQADDTFNSSDGVSPKIVAWNKVPDPSNRDGIFRCHFSWAFMQYKV